MHRTAVLEDIRHNPVEEVAADCKAVVVRKDSSDKFDVMSKVFAQLLLILLLNSTSYS